MGIDCFMKNDVVCQSKFAQLVFWKILGSASLLSQFYGGAWSVQACSVSFTEGQDHCKLAQLVLRRGLVSASLLS